MTVLAATVLARLQWGTVANSVVVGWWLYMVLAAAGRWALARSHRRASPQGGDVDKWRASFALGAGLAGVGWGAAGILLYPEASLPNQVFLVFVLGGMMLGGASLLAARPEAFLAFLIPTGLGPAIRLLVEGDRTHVAMGILAVVFTVAILMTTSWMHRTVDASLGLQFENRDLVESLQTAKKETEALNQDLELRVRERTAELHTSTEQLRAEIAQREQMEEELLRARKLESLGVLAGGIAHDFNNFLTVVQGNIVVAKDRLNPADPVQETLDQAASACQRAALLSSQFLTFAKGGAPVRRVVSVSRLVMDAVQLARTGAAIGIAVNIAEDLRCARVDSGQISQVLHNILLNARQAMPTGGSIEVRAENVVVQDGPAAEDRVRISIRDSGCGIPDEVLPQIFDPYFTTKQGSSGLGLATAHAIVSRHGGRISVESKPGTGTIFSVDLPASHENPAHYAPLIPEVITGTERLLVMDDEQAVRDLLRTVLGKLGYEVETARDGTEAVSFYLAAMEAGNRFDAVLLDLTVSGGMGGMEAAVRLKQLDPSARLIGSSGYSDAPVMSDFAKYGFDAVIPKPWTASEIGEVFRRVLSARS